MMSGELRAIFDGVERMVEGEWQRRSSHRYDRGRVSASERNAVELTKVSEEEGSAGKNVRVHCIGDESRAQSTNNNLTFFHGANHRNCMGCKHSVLCRTKERGRGEDKILPCFDTLQLEALKEW